MTTSHAQVPVWSIVSLVALIVLAIALVNR